MSQDPVHVTFAPRLKPAAESVEARRQVTRSHFITALLAASQPLDLRQLQLAAECLKLKAALYDARVKISALEKHNRRLTTALHRAHS